MNRLILLAAGENNASDTGILGLITAEYVGNSEAVYFQLKEQEIGHKVCSRWKDDEFVCDN